MSATVIWGLLIFAFPQFNLNVAAIAGDTGGATFPMPPLAITMTATTAILSASIILERTAVAYIHDDKLRVFPDLCQNGYGSFYFRFSSAFNHSPPASWTLKNSTKLALSGSGRLTFRVVFSVPVQ